ncbi:hypothetical protein [Nocardioides litoris]|nr:hypothetical protein [Nocardioides litoris]
MSKIRALLVSSLLASVVLGGTLAAPGSEAAPTNARVGGNTWCC